MTAHIIVACRLPTRERAFIDASGAIQPDRERAAKLEEETAQWWADEFSRRYPLWLFSITPENSDDSVVSISI